MQVQYEKVWQGCVDMPKGVCCRIHHLKFKGTTIREDFVISKPSEGKEGIFPKFWKTHNMTVAMVTGTNIFGGGACDST